MSFGSYSIAQLVHKIPRVVERRWRRYRAVKRAEIRPTYGETDPGPLASFLPDGGLPLTPEVVESLRSVSKAYCAHKFDLLGSGWMSLDYDADHPGFEGTRYDDETAPAIDDEGAWLVGYVNEANLAHARQIWRQVDSGYQPIDWQRDFRSGYRWSARKHTYLAPIGQHPGVDIKMPWELARMYHLPQIALLSHATRDREESARLAGEYKNQVLDFIATNPPGFGANWYTAMLTGIRAVNMLLSYDLFRAAGERFDDAFRVRFRTSMVDHGRFIVGNLEWWDFDQRNNHYLANIVGLLFISAYVPASPESDAWLAFALSELGRELDHQFNADGSNFESSTCYHAFACDLVAWSLALVAAVPEIRVAQLPERLSQHLPREARRRYNKEASRRDLWRMVRSRSDRLQEKLIQMDAFLRDVTNPAGRLIQIGDNDSGRLVKLAPTIVRRPMNDAVARYATLAHCAERVGAEQSYLDEDLLDYGSVSAALRALMDDPETELNGSVVATVIRACSGRGDSATAKARRDIEPGHVFLESQNVPGDRTVDRRDDVARPTEAERVRAGSGDNAGESVDDLELSFPGTSLLDEMRVVSYPDFGIYVYRSARLYLVVRCGPERLTTSVGHPHEDQLSVYLMVDGQEIIGDPGTYVYTASTEKRNLYRSASAHLVPLVAAGPADGNRSVFEQLTWNPARCLEVGPEVFRAHLTGPHMRIERTILIGDESVAIQDRVSGALAVVRTLKEALAANRSFLHSAGYGKLLNAMQTESAAVS